MTERDELRKIYLDSWQQYKNKRPLEPLQAQIIEIILLHPEYHTLLDNPDAYHYDFSEHNPFLHLGLHLALREQVATNRPRGIAVIYKTLCERFDDILFAEHKMIDCLADILWDAERSGKAASEEIYLEKLKNI